MEQFGNIKLYNGDCMEVMKDIPSESVDLIVTDCPYKIISGGITIEERKDEISGIFQKRAKSDGTNCSNKWLKKDENAIISAAKNGTMFTHNNITFKEWLPEIYRVLKNKAHCYIMINSRNLKNLQVEAEKVGFKFQNLLIWDKGNVTPNQYYMGGYELILMLRKGGAKPINNMGTSNIIKIPNIIGKKQHPTEKPIKLMEILIENSSNEGDVVLDPFIGSGSTGVAAVNLNRNFIGIELDEGYFNIATNRIQKDKKEGAKIWLK
jgi:site-specific DNA-methyltransferase (adenine-specific)